MTGISLDVLRNQSEDELRSFLNMARQNSSVSAVLNDQSPVTQSNPSLFRPEPRDSEHLN